MPDDFSFELDPNNRLDYTIDWSQWLAVGDSINTSEWIVPASLNKVSEALRQHSGTALAGAANSITLAASASVTDNFYTELQVRIIRGAGRGESRKIMDYVGSTKVANVDRHWVTPPDANSVYLISGATVWLSVATAPVGARVSIVNRITTVSSPTRIKDRTLIIAIKEQ